MLCNDAPEVHHAETAGFTLLELVIALGVGTAALMTGWLAVHVCLFSLQRPAAGVAQAATLQAVTARLQADAASATAITASADGKTITFLSIGDDHQWTSVAYRAANGLNATSTAAGVVQIAQVAPDITSLAVRFISSTALATGTEKSAALFTNVTAPQTYTTYLGNTASVSGVYEVVLTSGSQSATIHLKTDVSPTGFGVESGPQWRAVLGRVGHTHRSWLGLVQKTHYDIIGQIDYSYDQWQTVKTWCTYTVYSDLDEGDPLAAQGRDDPNETPEALFRHCEQQTGETGPPPLRAILRSTD